MQIISRFLGIMCMIAVAGCVAFWCMGAPDLLPWVPSLLVVGIVLLSLSVILDRLTHIEFLLKSSEAARTDRVKTKVGDFERLGDVEGQAMCIRCRKMAPKAGLYHNKSLDVYYHSECLALEDRK